jgi:flagellar biosynthetic protein FliR
MGAWEPLALGFLLVLFRCAALFMSAPIFGARSVPPHVRMGLAMAVALVAFQAAGMPRFAAWDRFGPVLVAVISECLIGLAAGLAARFCIEAAAAAGHAAGLTMGLGFSAVMDPIHGSESTSLSELLMFGALGVALAAGLHREAIAWFCRSIIETPPGAVISIPDLAISVVAQAALGSALAIRLGFPIMAAVLFGYVALGVLGRTAPALNLSNVGFAIALIAGGVALYMVSPHIAEIIARSARASFLGGT